MNEFNSVLEKQKTYLSQKNISTKERIQLLKKLKQSIKRNEDEIIKALYMDLGKSEYEAYTTEVGFIYNSINHAIKNIEKWNKVKKVKNDVAQMGAKSYIYNSAYGVVLIIGPYNYPFQLTIEPLIGAISGGNTVVLKPSEYTTNTESIIQKIIKETFKEEQVCVITGDYVVNSKLLDLEFDYIFFTGSVNVGKIVMQKASKHLIPHTLELGGKSPVIVDKNVKLEQAVERIAWGKFTNAGQTCVAPDYILVNEDIYEEFIQKTIETVNKFYGKNIIQNNDFGRIVNEKHMNRLNDIIQKDKSKVVFGGEVDFDKRYISPTILKDINENDSSMEDEIFGPIMPIIKYKDINDIKYYLKKYDKPLALYVFSEDKAFCEYIINTFSFGGGCINDTILQVASKHLPFGGVGKSGIGRYHGRSSFKTFTYEKAIVKKSTSINIKIVLPPYKDKLKLVKRLMK